MDKTEGKILIEGNDAAALGALFGGVTVAAWYPITPSTSLVDNLMGHMSIRKDPETGKSTVAIVQAEDELAAVGMIVGAGWAGARAMTATSGPGISLMAEFVGLAYFAEIPCVIWDITRTGPSTGLADAHQPGRPAVRSTSSVTAIPVTSSCCPRNADECFECGWRAFDLAEQLQTPVFVMSDLDLGMNLWLSDPFEYPDQADHIAASGSTKSNWKTSSPRRANGIRFRDYDGDGIPYRTVPGTDHPRAAFFTRGTGHNDMAIYSERSDDWVQNLRAHPPQVRHRARTRAAARDRLRARANPSA